MIIIGISGKMQAGKTYVAKRIIGTSPFDVIVPFAKPLKEDLVSWGFEPSEVWDTKPPAIRALMQAYGVARRHQEPNYWLGRHKKLVGQVDSARIVVVDDVRFPNEFDYLRSLGAYMVRLTRHPQVFASTHESETALDGENRWDADYTIPSGDMAQLDVAAEEIRARAPYKYANARLF